MAHNNVTPMNRRGPLLVLVLLCLIIGPAAFATATANCVVTTDSLRKACHVAGISSGASCGPLPLVNASCTGVKFPRRGLDAAENYDATCEYWLRSRKEGGGCQNDVYVIFTAQCARAAGNACGSTVDNEDPDPVP